MPSYTQPADGIRRVVLKPEITRAFWSRRRARHGDQVTLHVETRNVPDGTPMTLVIWEDDSAEGSPDDRIVDVSGDHRVTGNRYRLEYALDWSDQALGRELELEGDAMEFYFLVTIDRFQLEKRSTLLYVDLNEFAPSL